MEYLIWPEYNIRERNPDVIIHQLNLVSIGIFHLSRIMLRIRYRMVLESTWNLLWLSMMKNEAGCLQPIRPRRDCWVGRPLYKGDGSAVGRRTSSAVLCLAVFAFVGGWFLRQSLRHFICTLQCISGRGMYLQVRILPFLFSYRCSSLCCPCWGSNWSDHHLHRIPYPEACMGLLSPCGWLLRVHFLLWLLFGAYTCWRVVGNGGQEARKAGREVGSNAEESVVQRMEESRPKTWKLKHFIEGDCLWRLCTWSVSTKKQQVKWKVAGLNVSVTWLI